MVAAEIDAIGVTGVIIFIIQLKLRVFIIGNFIDEGQVAAELIVSYHVNIIQGVIGPAIGINPSYHIGIEVNGCIFQRKNWMIAVVFASPKTFFFTTNGHEYQCSPRPESIGSGFGKSGGHFNDGTGAAAVIIGAVINFPIVFTQVIVMPG